jgi:amidophosphoribosyltransferase
VCCCCLQHSAAYRAAITSSSSAWSGRNAVAHRRTRSRQDTAAALHMCGVIGIQLSDHDGTVAPDLYDALTLLQHRGQDAAGIATCDASSGRLHLHKDKGLVRDAVPPVKMAALRGSYGVGHVRYPTAGLNTRAEAQPFFVTVPRGFALAHNGHLTNVAALRDQLSTVCHINTDSDSEVLSQLLAQELSIALQHSSYSSLSGSSSGIDTLLFAVVQRAMARCRGGYAVVVALQGMGVLAFRDPNGIRPLCYGCRQGASNSGKPDWCVSSESAALTGIGFSLKRDLAPGEAVFLNDSGALCSKVCSTKHKFTPCIFEYVYMARPDSILDGVSVYAARAKMGVSLAAKVLQELPLDAIDVVVPVPETSRIAALHLAAALGLPYEEGLVKNRYIGRTFIMPGQEQRVQHVRKKLSPVTHVLHGKRVLLVDDSIVRGTTSRQIIQMVRSAGAAAVYFCSAAPPVRHSNVYGIDLPSLHELVAHGLTECEVADAIGADAVVYQELHALESAVRDLNPELLLHFENSLFTGQYVTAYGNEEAAAAQQQQQQQQQAVGSFDTTVAAEAADYMLTGIDYGDGEKITLRMGSSSTSKAPVVVDTAA